MFKTIAAFTTGVVVGAGTIGFLVAKELHGLMKKDIVEGDIVEGDIVEGDMVQWESNGVLMFRIPKKVVKIENSEFGKYAFVEGGNTGLPMEQLIKMS